MAMRGFVFELQPLLDTAREDKEDASDALALAEAEHRRQLVILRWRERGVARARLEAVQARRALFGCRASADAPAADAFVARCGEYLQQALEKLENQKGEVAWARERIALRRRELADALSRQEALARLRAQRELEHRAAAEKREELNRDDDSIQSWSRGPT